MKKDYILKEWLFSF